MCIQSCVTSSISMSSHCRRRGMCMWADPVSSFGSCLAVMTPCCYCLGSTSCRCAHLGCQNQSCTSGLRTSQAIATWAHITARQEPKQLTGSAHTHIPWCLMHFWGQASQGLGFVQTSGGRPHIVKGCVQIFGVRPSQGNLWGCFLPQHITHVHASPGSHCCFPAPNFLCLFYFVLISVT